MSVTSVAFDALSQIPVIAGTQNSRNEIPNGRPSVGRVFVDAPGPTAALALAVAAPAVLDRLRGLVDGFLAAWGKRPIRPKKYLAKWHLCEILGTKFKGLNVVIRGLFKHSMSTSILLVATHLTFP